MRRLFLVVIFLAFSFASVRAQYIEDALRYANENGIISTRAAGLGVSYHGIVDDISALNYNPAGLSLIDKNEISFGMGFDRNTSITELLNKDFEFKSNDAYISHFGFVAPFATSKGNASIAISYTLNDNYHNVMEFDAFNPNSSYIGWNAGKGNVNNIESNMAYHLWLADDNLNTPFTDSLQQYSFIRENGGLNTVTGGFGMELNENFSLGLNISGKWGTYSYNKEYKETDVFDVYNANSQIGFENSDFNSFTLDETLEQNVSGITGSVGIMGKIGEFMRITAGIDFPTFYEVNENFGQTATAKFDDGWEPNSFEPVDGENSYNLTTPFVYKAGFSVHSMGLTFTAGVEYIDVTQLEFSDAQQVILDLNKDIVRLLVGQTKWGFGAEYKIPILPIVARAGFTSVTSPYVADVSGATMNNLSLGAGIFVAKNVRIDGVFRWSDVNYVRTNYGVSESLESGLSNGSLYQYRLNPLTIGLQVTYRY